MAGRAESEREAESEALEDPQENRVIGLVGATPPPVEDDPLPSRLLVRKRGRWAVLLRDDPEERVALDLSLGGLFLAGLALPSGTRLELTLILGPEPADRLTLGATVRWSRQGRLVPRALRGVGVAFDDLDGASQDRLAAALEASP